MTVPNCVVLQTHKGEHLGFILLAVADGATRGECIFMVLPPNTATWSSPLVEALFARKDAGESNVQVMPGSPTSMHITTAGQPDLVIELEESGQGTWSERPPGRHSGRAAVASTD